MYQFVVSLFFLLCSLSCSDNRVSTANPIPCEGDPALLTGNGYVHYHQYPDSGTCYKGEVNFLDYDKMIAAVSSSIHSYFDENMGNKEYYVRVTLENNQESVIVAAIDKGGIRTDNFYAREQHIMDISEEAFTLLDYDGSGKAAGRLYVTWEIFER